jgi:putative tryptophan/tyrosine transport system substrate-binding protein
MRRREFITLLGGAAAAWPRSGRAQQGLRVRRVGVLMNVAESDPEGALRLSVFNNGLQELGWRDGHNLRDPLGRWHRVRQPQRLVVAPHCF